MRFIYDLNRLFFLLWGGGVGALNFSDYFRAVSQPGVTVGTSSAVSMSLLMWIGGLVFFGLGAILFRPDPASVAAASKPTPASTDWPSGPDQPRPGNHSVAGVTRSDTYRDRSFRLHGDGTVVALIDGAPMTWRSIERFKAWVDGQSAA